MSKSSFKGFLAHKSRPEIGVQPVEFVLSFSTNHFGKCKIYTLPPRNADTSKGWEKHNKELSTGIYCDCGLAWSFCLNKVWYTGCYDQVYEIIFRNEQGKTRTNMAKHV